MEWFPKVNWDSGLGCTAYCLCAFAEVTCLFCALRGATGLGELPDAYDREMPSQPWLKDGWELQKAAIILPLS